MVFRINIKRYKQMIHKTWSSLLKKLHHIIFKASINKKYLDDTKQKYFELMAKSNRFMGL